MAVKYNVVLVAGHAIGGDSGAVGQGTTEAIENAQIVNRVKNLLLPHATVGVDVVPHNLDYVDSTNWINQRYKWDGSDTIVVEVHLNAPAVASGTETLVGRGGLAYPETRRMAWSIQNAVVQSLKLPNRGVKEQSLYLVENCNPLACLVEVRFIGVDDNSDAADQKAAVGIANGICDFFRQPRPSKKPIPELTPKPEPVKKLYHVISKTGKQVGAFAEARNAYSKWKTTDGGVIRDWNGKDVTGSLVERFEPPVEVPEPVEPDVRYEDIDNRLTAVEKFVKTIQDFLASIFKNFKK